jgi:16S rRNA (guanine527-N7)-methyltransferase
MSHKIQDFISRSGAVDTAHDALKTYVSLIAQWNKAINLVAPSTLGDIWDRHILDSAQLFPIITQYAPPDKSRIIDLGSGGGLPGLVLAAMGAAHVTMVESDTRKCVFLTEAARHMGLKNVTIINERIEKERKISAPLITARALAPLKTLVEWAVPMLDVGGFMIFPKGENWAAEIAELPPSFHVEQHDSMTDKNAKILVIQ